MKGIIHNQSRELELHQEKQRIIKELNEIKVSSTVSLYSPKETHPVTINYDQAIEEIHVWLKSYGLYELLEHGISLNNNFDNASVALSFEDFSQPIKYSFKAQKQSLLEQSDALYERYGKHFEKTHRGKYIAISPEGKILIADSVVEVMQEAKSKLGPGNFILKIGERAVGKWL
jgi:hypothetical protein